MKAPTPRRAAASAGRALAALALLLAAIGCVPCAAAQSPAPAPVGSFPPAGIDLVLHDLRIDVFRVVPDGEELLETLVFEGRMMLQRGDPFTNADGLRQIDFQVLSWDAVAWSQALSIPVVYRSLAGEPQPTSTIVAEQPGSDFPATFDFNVIFDAYAGGILIFPRHHGRPKGHGFHVVPPNGNRQLSPTITIFEQTVIEFDHPELGLLRFKPKDCNDRESRTLAVVTAPAPTPTAVR
jgi:hypothetical protein